MACWHDEGVKSERAEAVGMLGGSTVVDHVSQDGGNTVAVSAEVSDVDGMMAALSAPPPEVVRSCTDAASSRR